MPTVPVFQLATDYRFLLCTFGESVMTSVIGLCGEDRSVDENLIKFIIFQIVLHHPNGASTEDQGTGNFFASKN